ncbi:hypothetical protein A4A49_63485, partial [Nicotiana attenuata]
NPTFKVLLKDSYIEQDYLHIPKYFYEHIPEAHTTAVLQYGGKERFMELNVGERRRLKDCWKSFVMKNDIKRGCLVKFELVEIAQILVVFKVEVKGQGTHEDSVEIN